MASARTFLLSPTELDRLKGLLNDGLDLTVQGLSDAYEVHYGEALDLDALVEWVAALRSEGKTPTVAPLPHSRPIELKPSPSSPPEQLSRLVLDDEALEAELERLLAQRDPNSVSPTALITALESDGWSLSNEYAVHTWLYLKREADERDRALGTPLSELRAPRLPPLDASLLSAFSETLSELQEPSDDELLEGMADRGFDLDQKTLKRLRRVHKRRVRRAEQNPRLANRESKLQTLHALPEGLANEQREKGLILIPVEFNRVASVFASVRSRARTVVRTYEHEQLANGSTDHPPLTSVHLRDLLAVLAAHGRKRYDLRTGDIVVDTSFQALHNAIFDSAIGGSSVTRLRESLEALRTRPIAVATRADASVPFGTARREPLVRDWYECNEVLSGRGYALRIVLNAYWFGELSKKQPALDSGAPRTIRAFNWPEFRRLTRSSARLYWFQAELQLHRRNRKDEPAKLLYENIPPCIGLGTDAQMLTDTLLELRRSIGSNPDTLSQVEAAEAALLRHHADRVKKAWLESALEGVVQLQGMRLSPDATPLSLWIRLGPKPMLVAVEADQPPPRDGEIYRNVWDYPPFSRARELWLRRLARRPASPG